MTADKSRFSPVVRNNSILVFWTLLFRPATIGRESRPAQFEVVWCTGKSISAPYGGAQMLRPASQMF